MTSRLLTAAVITLRDAQWSSEHFDVSYVIIGPKTAQLQQFENFGMHARTHARTHAHTDARTHGCMHARMHANGHAYLKELGILKILM